MLAEVESWAAEFERLCERIGSRFARPEVRRRAAGFLRGLLGGVDRKNGWQLAEHAQETTPDGMQRLLTTTRWDPEALRDDVRGYVVEHLGDPGGVLMVWEGIDDAAAFERLRSAARSSQRPLIDVVNEVLGGQRLSRPRR